MNKELESHRFLDFAYQLYKTMKTNEISLVYEGEVTQEITKTFTSLTEKNMAKTEESNQVQRKVFNVMVECLQNISKHADTFGSDDYLFAGRGIFMVSKGSEDYHVTTGNVIENRKIEELTDMLEEINSLDKEGLKQLYKRQMREGRLSDKGGAGLGFIDIARKTGNKLEYHFLPIDETSSFFLLSSSISRTL